MHETHLERKIRLLRELQNQEPKLAKHEAAKLRRKLKRLRQRANKRAEQRFLREEARQRGRERKAQELQKTEQARVEEIQRLVRAQAFDSKRGSHIWPERRNEETREAWRERRTTLAIPGPPCAGCGRLLEQRIRTIIPPRGQGYNSRWYYCTNYACRVTTVFDPKFWVPNL
jgi:murein DD-endopeptidase MepM/ murein hydrolase activator NlpD